MQKLLSQSGHWWIYWYLGFLKHQPDKNLWPVILYVQKNYIVKMPQFESLENKLMNIVRKPIYIHVTIFIIIYIVLSLISTWLQLIGKFPPRYDIFWFDNAIYNTLHGNGFFTILPDHYSISVKNLFPLISHFHQHNQPILFFLLPILNKFF